MARRDPALDALRAGAAAAVVVHHLVPLRFGGYQLGLDEAVVVFFVLSGYLLYRPFLDGVNLRNYAVRRAARILPAYWIALIGVGLIVGQQPSVAEFFFLKTSVLGVAWTLQLEVAFYIALPVIAVVVDGRPGRIVAMALASVLGTIAVGAIWLTFDLPLSGHALRTFPSFLWAFGAGMLVAALEARGRLGRVPMWVGWALVAGGIALHLPFLDVVTALGAAILIAGTINSSPWSPLGAAVASACAAVSYSAYLWHLPLIERFGVWGVAFAILVAASVYVAVERPVVRWSQRARINATRLRFAGSVAG